MGEEGQGGQGGKGNRGAKVVRGGLEGKKVGCRYYYKVKGPVFGLCTY